MSQNKIQFFKNAIQENPTEPFPYFALAKTYEKLENLSEARTQYEHLIRNFPDYGGTYYHLVLLLIELEDWEEAKAICDRGLDVLQNTGERQLYNELLMLRDQHFQE